MNRKGYMSSWSKSKEIFCPECGRNIHATSATAFCAACNILELRNFQEKIGHEFTATIPAGATADYIQGFREMLRESENDPNFTLLIGGHVILDGLPRGRITEIG